MGALPVMKRRIKNLTAGLLALCLLTSLLCSCSSGQSNATDSEDKISIVATVFPIYDWVIQLLGDRVEEYDVILLLDSGVDIHSFQPTVDNLVAISDCDLFLYVGGESDTWVGDALAAAVNADMLTLNLLELLGSSAYEEEVIEGMETAGKEDETAYDEHVWLSLRNAALFCQSISAALAALDPDGADTYDEALSAYLKQLSTLDAAYQQAAAGGSTDTLLFGDRFPFRYLVEDYGLNYYAAFPGCSAESEASFETVIFLAEKADELRLPVILTIDGSDGSVARAIADCMSSHADILTLNSMQSVTLEEAQGGVTYLSLMEENLAVLKTALGWR